MKRSQLKRRPKRMSEAEKESKARFRSEVLGHKVRCHLCPAPAQDAHHLIPAQTLRTHTSTMGEERWEIVNDPRNGIPVCRRCHDRITSRFRPVLESEVPDRAWEFASEHGLTWKLEQEAPEDGEFFFGDRAA